VPVEPIKVTGACAEIAKRPQARFLFALLNRCLFGVGSDPVLDGSGLVGSGRQEGCRPSFCS
jgi:hypothetical protein